MGWRRRRRAVNQLGEKREFGASLSSRVYGNVRRGDLKTTV
jgi:hypothetical protein